jgi:uncharacterized protein (DUF2236 family)
MSAAFEPKSCMEIRAGNEFAPPQSIVRTIWGDPHMVLLIFAGSAAEFALNRAVDWLYVTQSIPQDPLGRLFSTVHYAQRIIFAEVEDAEHTLARISSIHAAVERQRGERIPDWAHRDVLYMLIDHSQRAYELLRDPMSAAQREDLYASFLRLGRGLSIPELPATFCEWQADRERHLRQDLVHSEFTARLFESYRAHLGTWRYRILLEIQALLVPKRVRELLRMTPNRMVIASLPLYALIRDLGLLRLVECALVPRRYWHEVRQLRRSA